MRTLAIIPPHSWPEEVGDSLLRILRESAADEDERLLAIELASNVTVMNDEIAGALLALLCDSKETDSIRGAAAISLGPTLEELDLEFDDIDDPDDELVSDQTARSVRETLRENYLDAETPTEVRRRALEASVRAPAEWHAGAIRAAYYTGEKAWRLTAVFCMAYIAGFDAEVLEALGSEDPDLRFEAVRAAGNWEIQRAWPQVRSILLTERSNKELLLMAIEASGTIRPDEAPAILIDLIDSDDVEIAEAAAHVMSMIGGSSSFAEDDEW